MITPQEVQVWYVFPAVRRLFALSLKKQGLIQRDIAKIMNLTEAAVSQYLKGKRGLDVTLPKKIQQKIEIASKQIRTQKTSFEKEFQKIFRDMDESRFICSVCNSYTSKEPSCQICYG